MSTSPQPAAARVRVCKTVDVPRNGMRCFVVGGCPVLIANVEGDFYAIADTCTHANGSLSSGRLDPAAKTVECPEHAAIFDLKSGEALAYPAERPVAAYRLKVEGDDLHVCVETD